MPSSPKVFNMNYARLPLRFALSVCLTVVLAMAAYGQARSSLRGLITDELGAAIVGANVTLTDATGAQKKTTTNAEGVYTFTGLSAGKYAITAAAPG
ncbi:MAG TPA: carboxypeptidase-like regulatory domain-containing protein, partial [Pyrinomonadaceae bacterium]